MEISIVIPVYNEGKPLDVLCKRITESLEPRFKDYEIILIDDRSEDNSWDVMKALASKHPEIKIARLCRNFGQHNTLTAGLSLAKGNYIILMDCDQQDEPEQIPNLYNELIDKNVSIVYARRMNRSDKSSKKLSSYLINYILSKLSGFYHDPAIGTYRIMKRFVAESYLSMPEKNRYIGGMFFWLGFESSYIEIQHKPRFQGKSNYTFKRQMKLARLGVLSSSTKLLSTGIYFGVICSILSIIFGCYNIVLKILYNVPMGYTSIIVSIFFVSGIIMLLLGIIGEYLREIFEEIKGRPNFIIEEKINF